MSKVILAENAGFCFGVNRSVRLAEELLASGCEGGYCLGELIHNKTVVDELSQKGLKSIQSPTELPEGANVIIRSHGITKAEYEELERRSSKITDATCPKVKHIHELVSKAGERNRLAVIIGSKEHPEVKAIKGWCSDSLIFPDAGSFAQWLELSEKNRSAALTVVFQTTQTQKNLEELKIIEKKLCTNCEVFDTICGATSTRQSEAAHLSRTCGAMVVIGARHSANSVHLAEICAENCKNTQFISTMDELDFAALDGADTVGITAGASTPLRIIKEVKQAMTDETRIDETTVETEEKEAAPVAEIEKSFDQMLEDSIKTIYNGDTVTGIVAAITPTEISVDLGTKHSGYIPVSEFTDDSNATIDELVKVGDTVEACVVRVNDVEGTIMLSKKYLDAIKNWSLVEEAAANGAVLEGIVTEENKGGIVVSIKGVRVFVPASQTGLPKDAEMSAILKQKVRLKIKEVNRGRRRVVGSIRDVTRDERRERSEKIWNEIEVGKRYSGVVKSLTGYGAFVDIGGIDGMVHVSELSWSRIRQPSEVLSVGDEIEVFIISFDRENRKISLGYKDPAGNPWARFMESCKLGDVLTVKVVKLMQFGAFAEVFPGVDGLIHISQIAGRRIGKPDEVLTVGDMVDVKITAIDPAKQKVSLSIRALLEPDTSRSGEDKAEDAPERQTDSLVYEVSESGAAEGNLPNEDSEAAPAE